MAASAASVTSIAGSATPRVGSFIKLDMAWLSLAVLILTHAGFSQPAPEGLGLVQMVIGLLLVLLCGWRQPMTVITGSALTSTALPFHERLLTRLFLALVWLGSLRAAAAGTCIADVLRDLIPLAFLFLCLLISPRLRLALPLQLVAVVCTVAGGLFAWRFFLWTELPLSLWGQVAHPTGLDYLGNSPLVPFAACFGPVWLALKPSTLLKRPVLAMVLLAIAVLAWAAMATTTQRAPLGFSFLILLVAIMVFGVKAVRGQATRSDALIALAVGIPLLFFAYLVAEAVGPDLLEKTRLVGLNSRLLEWSAVWQAIAASPSDLLWGKGWGAQYASPAVGNYQVGYTHGLAAYLLLKTGLLGLAALVFWLAIVGRWFYQCARGSALTAAIALATTPPLLTALLFYTSYKHLGLGLLLLLVAAAAATANRPSPSA